MESMSEKNNFLYLVISLVALLFVGALVDQYPGQLGQQILQAVTVITLASGIIGFRSSKLWFHTGIGFVVSVLLVVILGIALKTTGLSYLHLLILVLFYLGTIWLAARQVLFTGPIDANKIIGAICIYLLAGLIWAMAYLLIAQAVPGAFNGLEQVIWYENFADAAYFSFVTLTTLGYGDISPVAPIARFLVYMEAIAGVFYMAILVASLIGIRTSRLRSEND